MAIDALLRFAFVLTGSRAVSEAINLRRMNRRWAAQVAAHKAAGGLIVTVEQSSGSSTYLTSANVVVSA